jgi:ribosomal protein S18 acetylase RimI-like enzyme
LATQCDAAYGTLDAPLMEQLFADRTSSHASRVVLDGARMLAVGCVRTVDAPGGKRACLYAFAEPGHPVLAELVEWLDEHSTEGAHAARFERVLAASTVDLPQDVVAMYARLGYARFYTELEMVRGVGESVRADEAGSVRTVPWSHERHVEMRDVYNAAFRERGFLGYSEHEWPRIFVADDDFQASVSFNALDGDEMVGFVLARVEDGTDGWIDSIGVLPSHWKGGIAARLISRVGAAVRELGGERVGLRVNEDNERAIRVYHRLGFVTTRKHVVYRRIIV